MAEALKGSFKAKLICIIFALAVCGCASKQMEASEEHNKKVVRALIEEALNNADFSRLDDYLHPSLKEHDPHQAKSSDVRQAFIDSVERFQRAFPDGQTSIELQIAEGDLVATKWRTRGTHLGDFMGAEASCATVEFGGMFFDRFQDGKLIETWANLDLLGLKSQIEERARGGGCNIDN